jgi:hypothetical protein
MLLFVLASQLTKVSRFTSLCGGSVSVDYILMIMLGSKENSHNFFFSFKYSHSNIHNNLSTNVEDLHYSPVTTDANPDGNGCQTASKLIEESE